MSAASAAAAAELAARERALTDAREQALRSLEQAHAAKLAEVEAAAADRLRRAEAKHAQEISDAQADVAAREAAWAAAKRELDEAVRGLSAELGQTRDTLKAYQARAAELDRALAARTGELAQRNDELAARTAELEGRTGERDRLQSELAARTGELSETREDLADAEERARSLSDVLKQRTLERDALQSRGEELSRDLAMEQARLQKARAKWGEDRASLERARQALAAAMSQIQEAEARPIE